MKNLLLVLLALAVAPTVSAQGLDDAAYYGLALGTFDYAEGDGQGGDLLSDSVSSYRLMVGYRFMEHLGVEGGYGETGTIRDTASLPLFGGGSVPLTFSSEFKILTIRLLGVLPFDNGLSLVGGLSYADMRQDIDFQIGTGLSSRRTSTATSRLTTSARNTIGIASLSASATRNTISRVTSTPTRR